LIDNGSMLWILFGLLVLVLLILDLFVFHRKSKEISINEALLWSAIWIIVALVFNLIIYLWRGYDAAMAFAAGYIVERSLSVDNLFVFLMIFTYFKVPTLHHYRVLFWGIIAAVVFRGLFVVSGIALIERFDWILYVFGALLIFTGIKMALKKDDEEIDLDKNPVLKFSKKVLPTTEDYDGGNFFVKRGGQLLVTPLFVVLLVVETSDIMFAIDSVPAVLGISIDPLIVYSSNIFAILGLRALYFALAGCMLLFHYLTHGVSFILVFIGAKMMLSGVYEIPVGIALGVIAIVLASSIALSILMPPKSACKVKECVDEK
jgi:tellurite resistance protein TerC